MDQLLGYVVFGSEHLVCRLRSALYGLKQSPYVWFDRFSAVVLGYGFQRSISNHYVFVRHSYTGTIILIVYVDDIIISRIESVGIADLKMLVDTAASLGSYHTMNRPSITFIFVVGTVSQFMHAARHPHFSYLALSEGSSWTRTFVKVVSSVCHWF